MSETEARSEGKEKAGRIDTVKPPASLPEGTPFERMTELARRLFAVPKAETIPPKKRPKRKAG